MEVVTKRSRSGAAAAASGAGGGSPKKRPAAASRVTGHRWSGRREVLAAQARERLRVIAELGELLRGNPFLEPLERGR
jgi:hypothetical protein